MKHDASLRLPAQAPRDHDGDEEGEPAPLSTLAPQDAFDRALRAWFLNFTGGSSPWAALQAWEDWAYHLTLSPARAMSLGMEAVLAAARVTAAMATPPGIAPTAPFAPSQGDRRFHHAGWKVRPYAHYAQAHLAAQEIWREATEPLPGVGAHHMRRVRFMGNSILNALAPTNFPWTSPAVQEAALQSGGLCFAQGGMNWLDDAGRAAVGRRIWGAEEYHIGDNLAVTPGEVVLRNDLMELIQYRPTTERVRREPILVVPAWIMKYYILDLTPPNSLIRYLVDQGFTVFCVSWKNPGPEDHDRPLDDYRTQGVMAALDAVNAIAPNERIHGVGYCLGGTMLAMAAATMARDGDKRLRSLSLLAAQTDFSEAGELMMFIDESQISALEDLMNERGYLDARQMAGAFYALRANEMLWSRLVERYLMGVKLKATDLDAWLADPTRMPARMHSQYLRWLFQQNRLAEGNLHIEGSAVALRDIKTPIFAVGAERDHIAPWRSVLKIGLFAHADTTFVLSGGGHNTAIVSPPGKHPAYYREREIHLASPYFDPDDWLAQTPRIEGSWWPSWIRWLDAHSAPERVTPPSVGAKRYPPLAPAPGHYVLG